MMSRRRLSPKGSRRYFTATASKGKAINYDVPSMRGGIRL